MSWDIEHVAEPAGRKILEGWVEDLTDEGRDTNQLREVLREVRMVTPPERIVLNFRDNTLDYLDERGRLLLSVVDDRDSWVRLRVYTYASPQQPLSGLKSRKPSAQARVRAREGHSRSSSPTRAGPSDDESESEPSQERLAGAEVVS